MRSLEERSTVVSQKRVSLASELYLCGDHTGKLLIRYTPAVRACETGVYLLSLMSVMISAITSATANGA
jgi:hypothetical protein